MLFCDLVDSTVLGERLDPETLRLVLGRFFDAVRKTVDRHGGQVEKYLGDAAVVVFGIPTAHEDDAVRAARAALELQATMSEVNADLAELDVVLQARIGIQSGDVLLDPASPHVGTIGGDIFNTAARLQTAAEPGGILVGSATSELLEGWADLRPLPAMELKGKKKLENAFVLNAVAQKPGNRRSVPFVGRVRHLNALRVAFAESVEDRASVLVTVLGVPGIGKSRVVERLGTELGGQATVLVGFTPTYGEDVAYAPLIGLVRTAAAVDGTADVLTGLRAIVGDRPDAVAVVERLTSLMGGVGPTIGGDLAWALRRLLEALSDERPVVVIVEDIHFGGDALLDLLDRVVASVRGPVLVVCTARPELLEQRPSWGGGKPRSVSITLGPLAASDSDELAAHLLVDTDGETRRRLTADSEGNPLYLEQLAARVSERGPNDGLLQVPPSLRALLAARLDHLTPLESRIMDLAAVEGRQFHTDTMAVLDSDLDRATVLEVLEHLETRSLVTLGGSGVWQFAHALIHDAATRRTPKEDRAALHVQLASHLAQADSPIDEVIGSHLERAAKLRRELGAGGAETAEMERRAGERYAAAGARAYGNLDLTATAELLGRAASLLPLSNSTRSVFLPDLGVSLMETGRMADAERLLRSASENDSDITEVQRARIDLQLIALRGVYLGETDNDAERLLGVAMGIVKALEQSGDQTALAEGWVVLEYLHWALGQISEGVRCTIKAVQAAHAARRVREQIQAGGDLGRYLSSGYLPVDEVERALGTFRSEHGPIWQLAAAATAATVCAFRGDRDAFDRARRKWAEIAATHGLDWPEAVQHSAMAKAQFELGDAVGAERSLRATVETMRRLGDLWGQSDEWLLPRALAMQGRDDEALALITKWEERERPIVLDKEARINERFVTALGRQLRGRLDQAETASRQAVDLAAPTDLAILHTMALEQLSDIVDAANRADEARVLRQSALEIHKRQGNLAGAARVSALLN
ncbi:MAG TPA: adenylate/guanylate cyclase domain-containing protein [Actinomycetes bacterium]|nr:adenylate/guanylate cyclase domain-containing protein [Actinomycetes bacterium]